MPLDAIAIALDRLAVSGERHRRDREAGFLLHFPPNRLVQGFAHFNAAARQRAEPRRRGAGPPHDQDTILADNRGTDSQNGALRIGPAFIHGVTSPIQFRFAWSASTHVWPLSYHLAAGGNEAPRRVFRA